MDQDRGPSQVPLLIDFEHFSLPLLVPLLIFIDLTIKFIMLLKLLMMQKLLSITFRCLYSLFHGVSRLGMIGFLLENGLIYNLISEHACETK